MGHQPPIYTLALLYIVDIIISSIFKVTYHRHNHQSYTSSSKSYGLTLKIMPLAPTYKLLDIKHWRSCWLLSSTIIIVILIVIFVSKRTASFSLTPRLKTLPKAQRTRGWSSYYKITVHSSQILNIFQWTKAKLNDQTSASKSATNCCQYDPHHQHQKQ